MSFEVIGIIILVGVFFLMMFLRVGVGISMGVATISAMIYLRLPIGVLMQGMVAGTNVFTFMAVPFFIFAGEIMSGGGITDRLIVLANALVGWMRGGAAMVNVVASMFFGGISGSATADCASLGPVEIKLMTGQGYDKDFSTCLTMASSVQGMLIPPSHNMVIYAVTAGGVSVGALLIGGLVPGIVLGIALMIYSYFIARIRNYPISERFVLKDALKAFFSALWGLLTIVIIVIGVSGGIMTATEAAAVAVLWALIVSVFIYRTMNLKGIFEAATRTVKTLGIIMVLIAASYSFGWVVAFLGIPRMIAAALLTLTQNKYVILLLFNILFLILGMFMSMSSIIIIVTPIIIPVLNAVGVNLVHFGVILILNLGLGLLTPPVGGVLYIGSAISNLSIGRLSKAMLPFYAVMVIVLMIITYVPGFSLWLPGLVGR